jgi:hypothetical protein
MFRTLLLSTTRIKFYHNYLYGRNFIWPTTAIKKKLKLPKHVYCRPTIPDRTPWQLWNMKYTDKTKNPLSTFDILTAYRKQYCPAKLFINQLYKLTVSFTVTVQISGFVLRCFSTVAPACACRNKLSHQSNKPRSTHWYTDGHECHKT